MIFKREFTKKIKLNIIGLVRNKIAAKFCNKINCIYTQNKGKF